MPLDAPAITLVEQNAPFRAAHVIWSAVTGTEEYTPGQKFHLLCETGNQTAPHGSVNYTGNIWDEGF